MFVAVCRQALRNKQTAYHLWSSTHSVVSWKNNCHVRRTAVQISTDEERHYTNHLKDILISTSLAHNWSASLKSALFDHNSETPPIIKPDGIFGSPPSEKVDQFSEKFDQAFKIITQQQLFLKSHDNKVRKKHLVITGLTEENNITGQ